jgi:putative transcriptional regulator
MSRSPHGEQRVEHARPSNHEGGPHKPLNVSFSGKRSASRESRLLRRWDRRGKRLIGAAREARAIARGEKKPANLLVPADVDVKAIRTDLKLTQESFAQSYGFAVHQIKDWEQHRCRPVGALRAYLMVIEKHPDFVLQVFEKFKKAEADKAKAEGNKRKSKVA